MASDVGLSGLCDVCTTLPLLPRGSIAVYLRVGSHVVCQKWPRNVSSEVGLVPVTFTDFHYHKIIKFYC